MKRQLTALAVFAMILGTTSVCAQKGEIHTVFKNKVLTSGGYGAAVNKFSTIHGKFANITGLYGGWFINHRFMIGAGLEAVTNNVHVPLQYSADPALNLSYEYGQFGLVMEYIPGSDRPIHPVFHLFTGAGFTLQYQRHDWHNNTDYNDVHDENWFFVAEPGVQLEINLFKWMRFSPGVSYRASFGSDGLGMKDKDLRNVSYSATFKFGRF